MNIHDIVKAFKTHQLQYGLDGDSQQDELYKWKLITKQKGHPNTEAEDFKKEILSLDLNNLCYSTQVTAYRNFAKYEPEDYRSAMRSLLDENIDLQQRVESFISTCKDLWDSKIKDNFENETSAMCDERLISCFLTLKYPAKYTFYKSDVYVSLCKLLGAETQKAGHKLVHFYELLKKDVVPLIESDKELMESVNEELQKENYVQSTMLTAQTALWHYVSRVISNRKQNIWLFYYADNEYAWNEMVKDNYLSIYEWGEIGEIQNDDDKTSIKNKLTETVDVYKDGKKEPGHSVRMLYDIKFTMKENDYVLCIKKDQKTIEAWGEVTGGYEFDEIHHVNNHRIGLQWNIEEIDISEIISNSADRPAVPPRLQNITKKEWAQKTIDYLLLRNQQKDITNIQAQVTMKEVEILKQKKQIVLQGAPGTGKTYKTAAIALAICDGESSVPTDRIALMERYKQLVSEKQIVFTTFHQSMDYEEFVEGIKPYSDGGEIFYNVEDGIFKSICTRASSTKSSNFDEAYKKFMEDISDLDDTNPLSLKTVTGKVYGVCPNSRGNLHLLTGSPLHKQGTLTKENLEANAKGTSMEAWQSYFQGVINHLKEKYALNVENEKQQKNYVLIIDEINRANISKVLGELITLLESDKRLGETNEVKVRLPYSKDEFGVPSNLYIIGTMNTADRSVGYIDYAIRRRFAFITIKADRGIVESYNSSTNTLALEYFDKVKGWMSEENIIGDIDADDLMVGHSYFLADNLGALKTKMVYEVIPLLNEYIKDGILNADIRQELKIWEDELK